jgi:D-3-phosphoglycerate dehydrogenase / 2-oxoglutarate reductase
MKILITCPPMLRRIDEFRPIFQAKNIEIVTPDVVQLLTETQLIALVPTVEGWIIGDDPVTERVLAAGRAGKLRAAMRWGIGTDNVDFKAAAALGIPITNTPLMFGAEVATLAVGYLIGLARHTYYIDREVRAGNWAKPSGMSLAGKSVAIIGFGDIGKHTAKFLKAFDLKITIYDPFAQPTLAEKRQYKFLTFPEKIENADFVVVTCALTPSSKHLINAESIAKMKDGVRIVNVSRGGVMKETAILVGLQSGKIHSVAMDVFEEEPFSLHSPLRAFENCIFGTHNGSNTVEAVRRASHEAIDKLFSFLQI